MNYSLLFQNTANTTQFFQPKIYTEESKGSLVKNSDLSPALSVFEKSNMLPTDRTILEKKFLEKIDLSTGKLYFLYNKKNLEEPIAVFNGSQIYCTKENLEKLKDADNLLIKKKNDSFKSFSTANISVTTISSLEMHVVSTLINQIAQEKLLAKEEEKEPEIQTVVIDEVDVKKEIEILKKIVVSNRLIHDPVKNKIIKIVEKNLVKEELLEIEEKAVEDRKKERQEVESVEKSREINGKEIQRFNLMKEIKNLDLKIRKLNKITFFK